VLHLAAKLRLVSALSERKAPFVIRRVCARFACDASYDQPWEPPEYDRAAEEIGLGTYRLDVAALQGIEVKVGFEVYFRHRIGRVKAAGLPVPWLEVQAEATAHNGYLLIPVVDDHLNGEDKEALRWSLGVSRADLPEALRVRLVQNALLEDQFGGHHVPSRIAAKIFTAREEGVSFLDPWWCPACADARERQVHLREERTRARETAERERTRQIEEAAADRARWLGTALEEQRAIFGMNLRRPFEQHELPFFEANAPVLRTIAHYLDRYLPGAPERLKRWGESDFVARRCWSCRQPMLCADVNEWVGDPKALYPMVTYFKPDPSRRGSFVTQCLWCGKRQRNRDVRVGGHVVLRSEELLRWFYCFGR